MQRFNLLAPVLCSLLAFAGCGGDDDDTSAAAPGRPVRATAEGLYAGTLTGSTSNAFNLLVLETGEFWVMFGTQTSSGLLVRGLGQGVGTSDNGLFTSSDFRDFSEVPAAAATVSATFKATTPTIAGTVTGAGGSVSFVGQDVTGGQFYYYGSPAEIATIAGIWSLTDLRGETVSLSIGADGAFTATSGGCTFSGSATPRPSGKDVFNVSMTFGPAPCDLPGQSATGIAIAYPTASGGTQLVVSAIDGTRTYGAAAFGTR